MLCVRLPVQHNIYIIINIPKTVMCNIPNSDVIAREEFDVCNEDEKGIDSRHGDKEERLD